MALVPDLEPQKRKRGPDDTDTQPPLGHQQQAMSFSQGNPGGINYLSSLLPERLGLIQGDTETFSDIINLISEYEGVLERHESLAASLGAKLAGPRLVKGVEKFFEGPIKTHPPYPYPSVSWLDICTFAKSNPEDFNLTSLPDGTRCCQFVCKGLQVEICEDDWRFISSGALNRLPLEHPMEEDEIAELATLDILDQRASFLYRKADEVAARARILHHKIGLRKQGMSKRRQSSGEADAGSRFHALNQPIRTPSQTPSYDVHQDLLQQFLGSTPTTPHSRSASVARLSQGQASPSLTSSSQPQRPAPVSRSGTSTGTEPEAQADTLRPLVTQMIDKLNRNEVINPPCDRCRRLKQQCLKHLTACVGCTKKHAKCSWKTATEEEVASLRQEYGNQAEKPMELDTESELMSPSSTQGFPRPAIDATLGRSKSAETSRSTGTTLEDPGGPAAFVAHNILSSTRQELPMIRSRTSLPSSQGAGPNAPITPLSQSSVSQMNSERPGWGPSNPPSR